MENNNQQDHEIVAGIDVGSSYAKAVVLNQSGVLATAVCRTGASPAKAGETLLYQILAQAQPRAGGLKCVVATGYGRISLPFADRVVTEISCHAKGVHYLDSTIEGVIDIGGQDSKAVRLNSDGGVSDFVMNDRCAAGTGRFLEIMASALDVDISRFGDMSLTAETPLKINNTCIVFAESEVISLLAAGHTRENIAAGLHESIARRVGSMANRVKLSSHTAFVGGVAKNNGLRHALETFLGFDFIPIHMDSQMTGALGAAVIAMDQVMGSAGWRMEKPAQSKGGKPDIIDKENSHGFKRHEKN